MAALRLLNGKDLVVTGSEDTYLKVSEFHSDKFKPVQTFSNHVASVRALCKLKLLQNENSGVRVHLIVSAGSRLQANVYKVIENTQDHSYSMGHICHFMRSFEQNDND